MPWPSELGQSWKAMPHFIVVTMAPTVIGSNAAQQVATAIRCSHRVVGNVSDIRRGYKKENGQESSAVSSIASSTSLSSLGPSSASGGGR